MPDLAITTLGHVKTMLGVTGTDSDARLSALIQAAGSAINRHVHYNLLADGQPKRKTIDHGTYCRVGGMVLLRPLPVRVIQSVTLDGASLGDGQWVSDDRLGLLSLVQPAPIFRTMTIAWLSGWQPRGGPGADPPDLPPDIEQAAIELIRTWFLQLDRDPSLKAETVLNGMLSQSFGFPKGMPDHVLDLLSPYIEPVL